MEEDQSIDSYNYCWYSDINLFIVLVTPITTLWVMPITTLWVLFKQSMTRGLKRIALVNLRKSLHLIRESGDSVVTCSVVGSVEADCVFTNYFVCFFSSL